MNISNTYEQIQDKSDTVWKNQRYQLIYEYINSPILPPPLNIFLYLWYLINLIKNRIRKTEHQIDNLDDEIKFESIIFFL